MSRAAEQLRQKLYGENKPKSKVWIVPILIFLVLSFSGYKDTIQNGLYDQSTHQTMAELGLMQLENSGVVWYGVYSYFNENPVVDLMYKTRPCKDVKPRGKFYTGHNYCDYFKDSSLSYLIGVWKPSKEEVSFLNKRYNLANYKNIKILNSVIND